MEQVPQFDPRRQLVVLDPPQPLMGRRDGLIVPDLETIQERGENHTQTVNDWIWLAN